MKKLSLLFVCILTFASCEKNDLTEEVSLDETMQKSDVYSKKGNKVAVCHKNDEIIFVNENAVKAHTAHGDALDMDGDGFFDRENSCSKGVDCDDTKAEVNPGMDEIPYNGIDDDCDPATLDDDLDEDGFLNADDCDDGDANLNPETMWYLDGDGDGFAISSVASCVNPGLGYTLEVLPLTDLDDNDPNVHDVFVREGFDRIIGSYKGEGIAKECLSRGCRRYKSEVLNVDMTVSKINGAFLLNISGSYTRSYSDGRFPDYTTTFNIDRTITNYDESNEGISEVEYEFYNYNYNLSGFYDFENNIIRLNLYDLDFMETRSIGVTLNKI